MKPTNGPGSATVVGLLFAIVSAIAAGNSLTALSPNLSGWGAASYAIVAAIFIAISTVVVMQVITALRD